jgi:choline kinase
MQALILAAGRGSRMGKTTEDVPKCLLEVGGKALIEHQLEALAECGVGPVAIVVGYCADSVREVVGIRAEYIQNPRWRNTNSLYSFSLAREWVNGDLLVLNSDLIFTPQIIERLLAAKGDALAFDSSSGNGLEHMKVRVNDGHLVEMSKTLSPDLVAGENVGILRFGEDTARKLFDRADDVLAENENCWLGAAVSELARERAIESVDVSGLAWGEIDFPSDLHNARKRIWPRIRPRGSIRSVLRGSALSVAGLACAILLSLTIRNSLAIATPPPEPVPIPNPTAWEFIEPEGVETVRISSDLRQQRWWRLATGETIEVSTSGRARVRIESRLHMSDPTGHPRYALAVDLAGEPIKWEDHLAETSETWQLEGGPVSKRKKIEFKVPEDRAQLRLRLVSPDAVTGLVRIAEEIDDVADE